ncbi:hypothetical protein ACNHYB_05475 [Isoptericola jiangsuensis]|uniref:hypothetical protein n=1 Tax=Isoptericola jiangsuensis TaxID=548579 RepID=UPI003AAC8923
MSDSLPDGAWHQRVVPRGTRWVVGALAVIAVAAVWLQAWILLVVPVVMGVNLMRSVVDVRIDASGLTVRAMIGRPRLHVPARDVLRAEVRTHVSPLTDFGGHGWRTNPGEVRGVVLRDGEALTVDRRDDAPVVVTVDDAAGAARALSSASRATRTR